MDETVLKIALAGFLHDIGKFADKDTLNISEQYINDNADLYQPHYKDKYTHRHAVYTAAFIEKIEEHLPKEFNQANWGMEDSFINLAAGHHNPYTSMQWIIAMADRISSGWDRETFEKEYNLSVAWQDYKKTRLLPIFEGLMKDPKKAGKYSYSYPLKALSPESIFPGAVFDIKPKDNETASSEYKSLFDGFLHSLQGLMHKEENLELWFEHFDSLFMIYTSAIPAARAGSIIPDVSLYDHSKITAALAVALYLYHRDKNTMNIDDIRDYSARKFMIISGDFFGIQNFIFSDSGEAGKNRAKILRGRSFAVSLFSELAADMLCRKIGIPSSSLLLNAAGKFTIIAPNTEEVKQAVSNMETLFNDWLMKISFGENAIGMTFLESSPEDFVSGNFIALWDKLNEKMETKKFHKYDLDKHAGTVEGYLDSFYNDLRRPLCPFCGKRPSSPELEGCQYAGEAQSICTVCHDHIWLGEQLVKKTRIAVTRANADIKGNNKLIEPVFGEYQIAFVDGGMKEMARNGQLLKYWDISIDPQGDVSKEVTAKFINGYVPVCSKEDLYDDRILEGKKSDEKKEELIDLIKEESPRTFGHIASKALNFKRDGDGFCGIEALGILKADVDQLGLLMSCGLHREQFTISRLATLSRQLNYYFAVYLPHLLKTDERFIDIYTVFAGGDDLFLIGPWNRIIDLVSVLCRTFADYVCHNDEIHFSAGISLHKPNTPLSKLADSSEEALEKSKSKEGKDSITLFSETVKWEEFMDLLEIKNTIWRWYKNDQINKAMIYRLNDFIGLAQMEKHILNQKEIYIEDMACLKWHSMFTYTTERNVGKGLKTDEKNKIKIEFSKSIEWLENYGSKLKISLWDILYNYR